MLNLTPEFSKSLDQAAYLVSHSEHVVMLAGAGLSVESGIPPFRGPGGLWANGKGQTNLSYREFLRNPGEWWETRFRNEDKPGDPTYELKIAVDQASPNPGHHAIVEMEQHGFLQCVVTQNVDNLHRVAGNQNILEIHGNRSFLRCIKCGNRLPRDDYHFDILPPRCTQCDGIIKMDTVMFGEPIPEDVLMACRQQVETCDLMLLVGTSGTVNPAARFPIIAKELGASLNEINPDETPLTPWCDIILNGSSGELLPLLLKRLLNISLIERGT